MTTVSDIDKQIAELESQRRALLDQERKQALKKAQDAVKELNALGYNYTLTETTAPKRRTGVRRDVLDVVKKTNGIKPADIAATLGLADKAGKQAVSNALTALKKAGQVAASDGKYRAA